MRDACLEREEGAVGGALTQVGEASREFSLGVLALIEFCHFPAETLTELAVGLKVEPLGRESVGRHQGVHVTVVHSLP